jgi:hypothetical protein
LIGQLIGGKHLCIYGSSKQGKTSLRKKHISPAEELCVVCDRKWTSVDVFAALLKAADCQVQRSSEDQSSSVYSARLPNGENNRQYRHSRIVTAKADGPCVPNAVNIF